MPLDHGGAIQYVDWTYEGCTIKGNILDGCGVNISSDVGCGSGMSSSEFLPRTSKSLTRLCTSILHYPCIWKICERPAIGQVLKSIYID
jgi:hypothetical protein